MFIDGIDHSALLAVGKDLLDADVATINLRLALRGGGTGASEPQQCGAEQRQGGRSAPGGAEQGRRGEKWSGGWRWSWLEMGQGLSLGRSLPTPGTGGGRVIPGRQLAHPPQPWLG